MSLTRILVAVLLLAIAVGVLWIVFKPTASDTPAPTGPTVTLPVSGGVNPGVVTTTPNASTTVPRGTRVIADAKGIALETRDFLKDETVRPDRSTPGRYLLAGNLGTCIGDQVACQAGALVPFNIFFNEVSQVFSVGITDEPIGENRRLAEQTLEKLLGLGQPEMCRLKYYVGTSEQVNKAFGGKNLGFSYCPGATVLP